MLVDTLRLAIVPVFDNCGHLMKEGAQSDRTNKMQCHKDELNNMRNNAAFGSADADAVASHCKQVAAPREDLIVMAKRHCD